MPIYEYQCVNCDAVTDIKHGFKETTTQACPACGGVELKRLFNPASIVFKGSGFYVTDSRKASNSGAAKVESAPKTDASTNGAASKGEAGPKSDSTSKTDAPAKSDPGGKGDAAA